MANFWLSVVELNTWHQHRVSKLIVKKLFGTVSGKKICILGFAFKANTNDTRESAAINICKDLLEEGAVLYIHDPKVGPDQISKDIGIARKLQEDEIKNKKFLNESSWYFTKDFTEGADGADAVVVLTEWREYRILDWATISRKLRKPAWIFDSRSIIPTEVLKSLEINFWRVLFQ